MPVYKLEGPGGKVYTIEGPEGATAEQLGQYVMSQSPGASATALPDKPQEKGLLDTVVDTGKKAGSAVFRGLAALPAMAVDLNLFDEGGKPIKGMPLSDKAGKIGADFETPGGKYAGKVIEGAAGALVGPGAFINPARSVAVGAGAGAGSEAAANLGGDNAVNRTLGALVGGGLTGLGTASKTTRGELAKETMQDVRDTDLDAALATMKAAKAQGINLNLSQAMPRGSNIDKTVDVLANNRHGTKVVEQLRNQPRDAAFGVETQLQGLPGQARQPQVVANRVQEGATAAISDARKAATAAWMKEAPEGSVIAADAVKALDERLGMLAAKYPNTPSADLINDARAALKLKAAGEAVKVPAGSGKVSAGIVQTQPGAPAEYLTDALQLKEALDSALDTFGARKLNTPGLDAKTLRRAQEVREQFKEVLDLHAPKLTKANQAYSAVIEGQVNPLKQSVVGRVAGQQGYDDAREAVKSKVFGVLDAGTVPGGGTSEILALERSLRKSDPEAFQDAVKTWMATKVSEATKQKGGRIDDNVAANLEQVFAGNDVKAQGFKDMLVGLARSKGLKDDALLPGMTNMMRYISAMARRPSTAGGTNPRQIEEASRSRVFGGIGNFSAVQPVRQPFKLIDDALNADAYKFMDHLLTSPEGIETLRQLGRQPIMSKAAANTIQTFAATLATSDAGEE